MRIETINDYQQKNQTFNARFKLVTGKSSLPRGATERLQKLANTIGTDADVISVGIVPKLLKRTVKGIDMFGRYEYPEVKGFSSIITKDCKFNSKSFIEPSAEITVPDTYISYPIKHSDSKQIKMNNYKAIYKYLLDLKSKFKPTV